jgi:hypothetical protein
MSAGAISLHEFISDFADSVAPQLENIHPSAQHICHEYFSEMRMAGDAGDTEAVALLIKRCRAKIADELFWAEEVQRQARDPTYRVRYFRRPEQEAAS